MSIVHSRRASAPQQPGYTILQQCEDRLMVALPNRMIVVAQQFNTAPVVSAHIYAKTGSIYEQAFTGAGLSHYLEHMLGAQGACT